MSQAGTHAPDPTTSTQGSGLSRLPMRWRRGQLWRGQVGREGRGVTRAGGPFIFRLGPFVSPCGPFVCLLRPLGHRPVRIPPPCPCHWARVSPWRAMRHGVRAMRCMGAMRGVRAAMGCCRGAAGGLHGGGRGFRRGREGVGEPDGACGAVDMEDSWPVQEPEEGCGAFQEGWGQWTHGLWVWCVDRYMHMACGCVCMCLGLTDCDCVGSGM